MKNLIEAILQVPTLRPDAWRRIFVAQNSLQSNNPIHRKRAVDIVETYKTAIEAFAKAKSLILQHYQNIYETWSAVQTNENKTPLAGDLLQAINISLVPSVDLETFNQVTDRLTIMYDMVTFRGNDPESLYYLTALDAAFRAKQKDIPGIIKSDKDSKIAEETVCAITTQQIQAECKKYKKELKEYILKEIEKDKQLYLDYFYPRRNSPLNESVDDLHSIIEQKENNIQPIPHKKMKRFLSAHPNVARAVANHRVVTQMEETLFTNQLPRETAASQALKEFYKKYPEPQRVLKEVGDEAIDKATWSFTGFLKMVWTSLTWKFSSYAKAQQKFSNAVGFFKSAANSHVQNNVEDAAQIELTTISARNN